MTKSSKDILQKTRKASAERSLLSFIDQAWRYVEPDKPFLYGWHIQMISEHLEAVTVGKIKNLVINVPPGCCKSLLTSVFWPCWVWTTRPSTKWMFASYQEELAVRDSMRCRTLLESHWFRERWGGKVVLSDDSNKRARFANNAGGWRLSTSIGGRGTGEHPDFVVADDPHKVKAAESESERQSVIDWWDGTISSRGLIHDSARVIVMQRIHEGDLSGHVVARGGYEHICLPMEAELGRVKPTSIGWSDPREVEDELLWPEAFSREKVDGLKRQMGSYHAAGQLQQRPAPRGGGMFKRQWFQIVREAPAQCRWLRFWDLAATRKKKSDYTTGCLLGFVSVGKQKLWFVKDMRRDKLSPHQVERLILQTATIDGNHVRVAMEQEPGASGVNTIQNYQSLLTGFSFRGKNKLGSKEVRADIVSASAEAGNIMLVEGHWNAALLNEIESFPNGQHDDQVDALSGAFMSQLSSGSGVVVSNVNGAS